MPAIIDTTNALGLAGQIELAGRSIYVLDLTIAERSEDSSLDFEGIDSWYFDEYRFRLNEQLRPAETEASWTNRSLSLPGVRSRSEFDELQMGSRYIAFYDYSAHARGYALEGLMKWNEAAATAIRGLP